MRRVGIIRDNGTLGEQYDIGIDGNRQFESSSVSILFGTQIVQGGIARWWDVGHENLLPVRLDP